MNSNDFITMIFIQLHGKNTTSTTACLTITVTVLLNFLCLFIEYGFPVFIQKIVHITITKTTALRHTIL